MRKMSSCFFRYSNMFCWRRTPCRSRSRSAIGACPLTLHVDRTTASFEPLTPLTSVHALLNAVANAAVRSDGSTWPNGQIWLALFVAIPDHSSRISNTASTNPTTLVQNGIHVNGFVAKFTILFCQLRHIEPMCDNELYNALQHRPQNWRWIFAEELISITILDLLHL